MVADKLLHTMLLCPLPCTAHGIYCGRTMECPSVCVLPLLVPDSVSAVYYIGLLVSGICYVTLVPIFTEAAAVAHTGGSCKHCIQFYMQDFHGGADIFGSPEKTCV